MDCFEREETERKREREWVNEWMWPKKSDKMHVQRLHNQTIRKWESEWEAREKCTDFENRQLFYPNDEAIKKSWLDNRSTHTHTQQHVRTRRPKTKYYQIIAEMYTCGKSERNSSGQLEKRSTVPVMQLSWASLNCGGRQIQRQLMLPYQQTNWREKKTEHTYWVVHKYTLEIWIYCECNVRIGCLVSLFVHSCNGHDTTHRIVGHLLCNPNCNPRTFTASKHILRLIFFFCLGSCPHTGHTVQVRCYLLHSLNEEWDSSNEH